MTDKVRELIKDAQHHFSLIGLTLSDQEAAVYVADFVADLPHIDADEKRELVKAAEDVATA